MEQPNKILCPKGSERRLLSYFVNPPQDYFDGNVTYPHVIDIYCATDISEAVVPGAYTWMSLWELVNKIGYASFVGSIDEMHRIAAIPLLSRIKMEALFFQLIFEKFRTETILPLHIKYDEMRNGAWQMISKTVRTRGDTHESDDAMDRKWSDKKKKHPYLDITKIDVNMRSRNDEDPDPEIIFHRQRFCAWLSSIKNDPNAFEAADPGIFPLEEIDFWAKICTPSQHLESLQLLGPWMAWKRQQESMKGVAEGMEGVQI